MPDKKALLSCKWSDYLNKAIAGYDYFANQPSPIDAKEFTMYQNACKAALTHIVLIKKMMQQENQTVDEPDFWALLEQARKETDEQQNDDSFD